MKYFSSGDWIPNGIIYNVTKFRALDQGSVWLSATPDVPHSTTWSHLTRSAFWAVRYPLTWVVRELHSPHHFYVILAIPTVGWRLEHVYRYEYAFRSFERRGETKFSQTSVSDAPKVAKFISWRYSLSRWRLQLRSRPTYIWSSREW